MEDEVQLNDSDHKNDLMIKIKMSIVEFNNSNTLQNAIQNEGTKIFYIAVEQYS